MVRQKSEVRGEFEQSVRDKSGREVREVEVNTIIRLICTEEDTTANISKFSDSENAPKNFENLCNYTRIF